MKKLFIPLLVFISLLGLAISCSVKEELQLLSNPDNHEFEIVCDEQYDSKLNENITDNEVLTKSSVSKNTINKINNLNMFIYRKGKLENGYSKYIESSNLKAFFPTETENYNIYFVANVGKINAPEDEKDISDLCCNFNSFEDFEQNGIPMANVFLNYKIGSKRLFKLRRLFAEYRIFLSNHSSKNKYKIKSIKIKNAALSINPFASKSKANKTGDGDYLSTKDISSLNKGKTISIFLLENMQGELLKGNTDPLKKNPQTLEKQYPKETINKLSYLEIEADVTTPTATYSNNVYRAYLGQNNSSNFDIKRNSQIDLNINFNSNVVRNSNDKCHDNNWRSNVQKYTTNGYLRFNERKVFIFNRKPKQTLTVQRSNKQIDYELLFDHSNKTRYGDPILFAKNNGSNGTYTLELNPKISDKEAYFVNLYLRSYDGLLSDNITICVGYIELDFNGQTTGKEEHEFDWIKLRIKNNPYNMDFIINYEGDVFAHLVCYQNSWGGSRGHYPKEHFKVSKTIYAKSYTSSRIFDWGENSFKKAVYRLYSHKFEDSSSIIVLPSNCYQHHCYPDSFLFDYFKVSIKDRYKYGSQDIPIRITNDLNGDISFYHMQDNCYVKLENRKPETAANNSAYIKWNYNTFYGDFLFCANGDIYKLK